MTPNRMDSAVYPMLARFFAAIEWWKLVPHPGLFADGIGGGETLNAAMYSPAGDRLPVYLSAPVTFSLPLDALLLVEAQSGSDGAPDE